MFGKWKKGIKKKVHLESFSYNNKDLLTDIIIARKLMTQLKASYVKLLAWG